MKQISLVLFGTRQNFLGGLISKAAVVGHILKNASRWLPQYHGLCVLLGHSEGEIEEISVPCWKIGKCNILILEGIKKIHCHQILSMWGKRANTPFLWGNHRIWLLLFWHFCTLRNTALGSMWLAQGHNTNKGQRGMKSRFHLLRQWWNLHYVKRNILNYNKNLYLLFYRELDWKMSQWKWK